MDAIRTEGLTKRYGDLLAVDHVDLEINEGELYGLLGPNGAGKTTFVHMLSTLLSPTEGDARIFDHNILTDPESVRLSIGIVFQDPSSDERLTGLENLEFHGRMYGVPKDLREEKSQELLEMVELSERGNDLVKKYSGGMRRRLELARGFLHEPKVLFLDEPTLGLDPQSRKKMWDYIQHLNKTEGITMVLTTHYLEEADYLCDRVGIIDRGKIIAEGDPDELKKRLRGDIVLLSVSNPKKSMDIFNEIEFVQEVEEIEGKIHLIVEDGEDAAPEILKIAREKKIQVNSVNIREPTLDDVFIDLTGERIRDEEAGGEERMRIRRRAGAR